jgi:hypothetical protein
MHYREIEAAAVSASPGELKPDSDARCVLGCYRCLLSYYNQPDHELIDRTNRDALTVLLRLARSQVAPVQSNSETKPDGSWHAALARWGLPPPDKEPLKVHGAVLPLAWRTHLTAAATAELDASVRAAAEAQGYVIAILPPEPGDTAPQQLVDLLGASA